MADEAADTQNPGKDVKEEAEDMESQIKSAMRSRVAHFKEQSDSLTFEGVRRLLEEDMGLETYALDVHKRFVKQCLLQNLESGNDENGHKTSAETGQENGSITAEADALPKRRNLKKDEAEPRSEGEEKMEDSPVMGLLTAKDTGKAESAKSKRGKSKGVSEAAIKKAIKKRASYVKANSEKVTMAGLRRLLEEDMKLDEHTLDPYKKFISTQLDEVLRSHEVSPPASEVKKAKPKATPKGRAFKKSTSEDDSDSSESEGAEEEAEADEEVEEEEESEEEEKPRRRTVPKGKLERSEVLKKRKRPEKETEISKKKRLKPAAKKVSDDNSDAQDSGNVSEDAGSQSSSEKVVKRKEVATPTYGKRVEHLKSVIKSCGMSVPPSVYRKAKQVPESKRETQLIKELEEILSKEGLSSDPSEKEIKEVRKRKERAKELEGIDTSNIVTTSRRRSVTSFAPPPKPKIPDESDGDDSEDTDEDDEDDEHNDENDEDGGDEGNDDSRSEEEEDEDVGEDSD